MGNVDKAEATRNEFWKIDIIGVLQMVVALAGGLLVCAGGMIQYGALREDSAEAKSKLTEISAFAADMRDWRERWETQQTLNEAQSQREAEDTRRHFERLDWQLDQLAKRLGNPNYDGAVRSRR